MSQRTQPNPIIILKIYIKSISYLSFESLIDKVGNTIIPIQEGAKETKQDRSSIDTIDIWEHPVGVKAILSIHNSLPKMIFLIHVPPQPLW